METRTGQQRAIQGNAYVGTMGLVSVIAVAAIGGFDALGTAMHDATLASVDAARVKETPALGSRAAAGIAQLGALADKVADVARTIGLADDDLVRLYAPQVGSSTRFRDLPDRIKSGLFEAQEYEQAAMAVSYKKYGNFFAEAEDASDELREAQGIVSTMIRIAYEELGEARYNKALSQIISNRQYDFTPEDRFAGNRLNDLSPDERVLATIFNATVEPAGGLALSQLPVLSELDPAFVLQLRAYQNLFSEEGISRADRALLEGVERTPTTNLFVEQDLPPALRFELDSSLAAIRALPNDSKAALLTGLEEAELLSPTALDAFREIAERVNFRSTANGVAFEAAEALLLKNVIIRSLVDTPEDVVRWLEDPSNPFRELEDLSALVDPASELAARLRWREPLAPIPSERLEENIFSVINRSRAQASDIPGLPWEYSRYLLNQFEDDINAIALNDFTLRLFANTAEVAPYDRLNQLADVMARAAAQGDVEAVRGVGNVIRKASDDSAEARRLSFALEDFAVRFEQGRTSTNARAVRAESAVGADTASEVRQALKEAEIEAMND